MKKEDLYARMMHTPDDPARAEVRAALRDTWKQLMPLHRALIDSAKEDYVLAVGPISSPTHLLRLLQEDPFFAWLQPMTSLIVDIDTLSRTDFEPADIDGIAIRLERFFGNAPDPDFSARYVPVLQREIDVAAAHAALRKLLKRLRQPA